MNLVGSIVRGEMLRRVDNSLNSEDIADSRARLLASPLFDVAKDRDGFETDEEIRHARDDVFNTDTENGWWPDTAGLAETGAEREKIIRAAYIRALDIRERSIGDGVDKKIRTLWIRGMNRVEAYVIELDTEILVQWLTPDVPPPADPTRKVPPPMGIVNPILDEGIWAAGTTDRIGGYVQSFKDSGYPIEAERTVEYPTLPGVMLFEVIGY